MNKFKIILLLLISVVAIKGYSNVPHCSLGFDVLINRTGCNPNDTKLVILPFAGTAPYTYSLDGGATFGNDSIFYGLAPGTYYIFVKDADTTAHTPCQISSFEVIPGPIVLDSIITDSSCSVNSGKIEIYVSEGEPNYFYSINNGTTFIPDSNEFENVGSGTYNVIINDNNNCPVTSTVTIGEYPIIAPVIDTQDILCNTGIFKGLIDVTFTGSDLYQFSIDGGIVYTTGTSYNNPNLDTGIYNFEIIDKNGCSYFYPFTIDQQVIEDSLHFTNESCLKANGEIELFGAQGVVPFQYSVDGGATFAATGLFQSLTEGFYYTQVKDNIGCISYDTIRISNFGGFTLSITSDDTVCNGNSILISATNNAGFGTNYVWANGLPNAQSHTIFPTITTNYSVIATDNFGCKDTADKLIFVEQQPNVTVSPTNILACLGDTITVAASGANQYTWFNGDTNQILETVIAGNSNITVVGNNGKCTDNASVIVQLKPMPTVIASANILFANSGDYINFYSTGSVSSSYDWDFDDGNTSMVSNPIHQFIYGGTYYVTLTGSMGQCGLTDTVIINVNGPAAGINDVIDENLIAIYPNPANKQFNIDIPFESNMIIINAEGKTLYAQKVLKGKNLLTDLNLSKGIYVLRFENQEGVINKKLVIK